MDQYRPHGAELGRVMAFIVGKPPQQQVEFLVKELAAAFVTVHEVLRHEAKAEQRGYVRGEASGIASAKRSMNASASEFAKRMRKEGRADAADAMTEWVRTKAKYNEETSE